MIESLPALPSDVSNWVTNGLLVVVGWFLRDVAAIQKSHTRRIGRLAQRVAILDGNTEDVE